MSRTQPLPAKQLNFSITSIANASAHQAKLALKANSGMLEFADALKNTALAQLDTTTTKKTTFAIAPNNLALLAISGTTSNASVS